MARVVASVEDFEEQLALVRARSKPPQVLAFFLFDERESHGTAADFAVRQFHWLNSLADANRMVLFFSLPTSALQESTDHVLIASGAKTIKNSSLEKRRTTAPRRRR